MLVHSFNTRVQTGKWEREDVATGGKGVYKSINNAVVDVVLRTGADTLLDKKVQTDSFRDSLFSVNIF